MRWQTLVTDLDNTLYSSESGVFNLIDRRIGQYLCDRLGWSALRAQTFRAHSVAHFGTTLRGLRCYHPEVDPMDFLQYAHDIPLADLLSPQPDLRQYLEALPLRKVLFTNSDRVHTERVLEILNLSHLFSEWITVERMEFIPKPFWESYAVLMETVDAPERTLFVDDRLENLYPAVRWGLQAVWLNETGRWTPAAQGIPSIRNLFELEPLMARL